MVRKLFIQSVSHQLLLADDRVTGVGTNSGSFDQAVGDCQPEQDFIVDLPG